MTQIRTYRDLIAWQKAMDLTESGYRWTETMPSREQFGLTSQIRRALVSVPSNIAEGWARGPSADYVRMLRIARGSLAEASTQAELIDRLGMLQPDQSTSALMEETDRVLPGLIRSVERS